VEGDGDKVASEEIWTNDERTIAVHYIDEAVSGMVFVCVRGRVSRWRDGWVITRWLGNVAQRFEL